MVVCKHCFNYLESREGRMPHKHVENIEEILQDLQEADEKTKQKVIVNIDEEIVRCEWCEEEFEASETTII